MIWGNPKLYELEKIMPSGYQLESNLIKLIISVATTQSKNKTLQSNGTYYFSHHLDVGTYYFSYYALTKKNED